MSFDSMLDHVARSSETRNNILTDGQFTCIYGDLPDLLRNTEQFLKQSGISSADSLAVECNNSLSGALLVLTLLRSGMSFVLTPPAATSNDLKPTPHFCRFRLTVTSGGVPRVELNPTYNGRPAMPAKLYLRTSGSMGTSKIVVHSHQKLLGNARNLIGKFGFTPATRAVIPVPIAHMYGLGAEFLPAIITGASIDLQEKTNLLKYLDRERIFQPTIAFGTPALCEMLLKAFKSPRTNYQVFVTSGQRIAESLFRAFDPCVGGALINQYGSTEMGAVSACDPGDDLDNRATTIGIPLSGVRLRLQGCGELYCLHPHGFEGYIDENGDWLEHAPADGWYRTGDLAAMRADGDLVVSGRADASVNRRGYLILLGDLERILERFETLSAVVVVAGKAENNRGQRIAAFCVPRAGNSLDRDQLRQHCFDVLPHYAIPDEVHITETLPLLPSGKVDRQGLSALVQ